jgi:hypothetical protein
VPVEGLVDGAALLVLAEAVTEAEADPLDVDEGSADDERLMGGGTIVTLPEPEGETVEPPGGETLTLTVPVPDVDAPDADAEPGTRVWASISEVRVKDESRTRG